MVVVVGLQPENSWLDLVNVKLPVDPTHTSVTFNPSISDGSFNRLEIAFSFPSTELKLSTYSHHFLFTSSFGVAGTGFLGKNNYDLDYLPGASSSTSLKIQLRTYAQTTLRTIFWGVLVLNQAAQHSTLLF